MRWYQFGTVHSSVQTWELQLDWKMGRRNRPRRQPGTAVVSRTTLGNQAWGTMLNFFVHRK